MKKKQIFILEIILGRLKIPISPDGASFHVISLDFMRPAKRQTIQCKNQTNAVNCVEMRCWNTLNCVGIGAIRRRLQHSSE